MFLTIFALFRRVEAWRYISYSLVHSGLFHVTFNILIQLVLGIPLEMVHRILRFCSISDVISFSLALARPSLLQILLGVRHNLRLLGIRVQLHGVHHGQVGGEGAPVRGHLAHPDNIDQSEASIEVT